MWILQTADSWLHTTLPYRHVHAWNSLKNVWNEEVFCFNGNKPATDDIIVDHTEIKVSREKFGRRFIFSDDCFENWIYNTFILVWSNKSRLSSLHEKSPWVVWLVVKIYTHQFVNFFFFERKPALFMRCKKNLENPQKYKPEVSEIFSSVQQWTRYIFHSNYSNFLTGQRYRVHFISELLKSLESVFSSWTIHWIIKMWNQCDQVATTTHFKWKSGMNFIFSKFISKHLKITN